MGEHRIEQAFPARCSCGWTAHPIRGSVAAMFASHLAQFRGRPAKLAELRKRRMADLGQWLSGRTAARLWGISKDVAVRWLLRAEAEGLVDQRLREDWTREWRVRG